MTRKLGILAALTLLLSPAAAFAQATVSIANDGVTGTTIGAPAKYTTANPTAAIVTSGGETSGVQGIVVSWGNTGAATASATTGFATIARLGQPYCQFDASGVTAGHWVINSATGGRCADSGTAGTSARPTGKDVFGIAISTVAANGYGQVDMQLSYLNAAGSGTFANPTGTIGTAAVNGSATTAMRSDGAPAIPQCSSSTFGACKVDGTTITASSGVISASGGVATSITPGTTTVVGATAPCLIDNSASTTMGCSAVGTGVLTALGVNVGTAGAPVVLNGALGTPSSGTGTNITAIPNNNVLAATLATGTSVSLTAPREYYVCTGTCTVTPPVPAAGYEFCVMNDDNVTTVITLAAIGSSARYEATARTSYGTAGTGTFISGGAAGDKVCLLGRDSTHYLTASFNGTWTAN